MIALFWASIAVVAYAYVGYPLAALIAGRILARGVRKASHAPSVSVIIAAYNEEDGIASKLRNVLCSSYPRERLEVVVASDGSRDRTVEIASSVDPERVRVMALPRQGKAAALEAAVRHASGEILVFTDANTVLRHDAVAAMMRNFADPDVGGVVGHTTYELADETESAGRGEGLYWRYDTWIKDVETATGSVVSAHGGMYAVRRALFRPVEDPSVTDDFAIATAVVEQGERLVFEAGAIGHERPMPSSGSEYRRRVRLMTRGLRGVVLRRRLLNPFRYGFYAVALASRKVLRRLVPLMFLPLLVSSWALAGTSVVYTTVAVAQLAALVLAEIGWANRRRALGRNPIFYVPFFFCMANAAALVALWNVARGRRVALWTPQRHAEPQTTSGATSAAEVRWS